MRDNARVGSAVSRVVVYESQSLWIRAWHLGTHIFKIPHITLQHSV